MCATPDTSGAYQRARRALGPRVDVAAVLMIGGLALLGALAGSLAAFLRIQDIGGKQPDDDEPATSADLVAELTAMREQVRELNRRLGALQAATERNGEREAPRP